MNAPQRSYADPYLAGVALGLVLLASFVIAGRGLGASGAFATAAATTVQRVAPDVASRNEFLATHLDAGGLLRDWLVVEILGVVIGGWCSAALAGRMAICGFAAFNARPDEARRFRPGPLSTTTRMVIFTLSPLPPTPIEARRREFASPLRSPPPSP